MPQENCQKVKLLKLVDLLRQETDEDHPLTTTAICEKLAAMNISCDRRIPAPVVGRTQHWKSILPIYAFQ